jgi:hypothetical protein
MVEEEVLLIVTDDEIMNVGLKLTGYSDQMIQRVQIEENKSRFCLQNGRALQRVALDEALSSLT